MREPDKLGYGLVGIGERVRAIGGRLSFSNDNEMGFTLLAVLPRVPAPEPRSSLVEAAAP